MSDRKGSYKKRPPKKMAWGHAFNSSDDEEEDDREPQMAVPYGASETPSSDRRPSSGARRPSNGARRPSTGAGRPSNGSSQPDMESSFSNLSFTEEDDEVPTGALLIKLTKQKQAVNAALQHWKKYRAAISTNREELHQAIEQRKEALLREVEERAAALHEELNARIAPHKKESSGVVSQLEKCQNNIEESEASFERQDSHRNGNDTAMRQKIHQLSQHVRISLPRRVPYWQNLTFSTHSSQSPYLLSHLFGQLNMDLKQEPRRTLMDKPELLKTFNCKTSKDNRENGITDIALLNQEKIIVVDKHNKLVKMFHGNGKLMKLVGRGILKDPCRVCVAASTSSILVTDSALKCVKMFDSNGEFVRDLITKLSFPSAICQNYNDEILVVEFDKKAIFVHDEDGKHIHTVDIGLSCAAHMSVSKGGHIYITDWKASTMKVFDVAGNCVSTCDERGSGITEINQPQGIHVDSQGYVFLADKGNHRIQLFDSEGKHMKCLIPKTAGIKLPMAVTSSDNGLVVVAEYTGVVKVFRYLEDAHSDDEELNVVKKVKSGKRRMSSNDDIFAQNKYVAPDGVSLTEDR